MGRGVVVVVVVVVGGRGGGLACPAQRRPHSLTHGPAPALPSPAQTLGSTGQLGR
jgi:hypothetical protein